MRKDLKPLRKVSKTKQRKQPKSHIPRALTRVVGTGVEAPKWTGRVPQRHLSRDGRSCEYRSMDYVGTVSISSTAQVGDVLFSLALSPLLVPATRLQKEAGQWERYAPREWEFLLSSMHGTTFDGQVIAFVDPDPADVWTNSPLNINKAAAQFNSQPDNVWKNFETCLPIVPGVPDFYTNPVTTSDVRFTQAGVLRIVYTGGCVFPSGVTSYQLFNVYQWVDLRFSQPELEVAATSSIGQAKTTTPLPTNLLNGATVSSAIPVTITSSGANIDTGNLGGNNLVVELITQASNLSDVASAFGVDLGIEDALDSVKQVTRLPEKSRGEIGEAVSQFLLSGEQSWSVTPTAFGLPNVQLPSSIMNLFPVPSTILTLEEAAKHTRQRKISAAPSSATTISGLNFGTNCVQGDWCFAKAVSTGSRTDLGFNPAFQAQTITVGSTNYPVVTVTWTPAGPGEVLQVTQIVSYSNPDTNTSLIPADSMPFSGVNYTGALNLAPTGGGATRGQMRRLQFTSLGSGQCQINLVDVECTGTWGCYLYLYAFPSSGIADPVMEALAEVEDVVPPRESRQLSESSATQARLNTAERFSSLSEDEDGFCTVGHGNARKVTIVPRRTAQ